MYFKHGLAGSPEYISWRHMVKRCTDPTEPRYHRYGGRGIKVCARWLKDPSNFLADMGKRPSPEHSLDRIDNDGDYTPENCRWATLLEQVRNRGGRRPTCRLTMQGETLTIVEWAQRTGLSTNQIRNRLRKGWSTHRALTAPVDASKRNKQSGGWVTRHLKTGSP